MLWYKESCDLTIYDFKNDKFENNFVVVDDSDDYGNWYTRSTIFPNNYIVTIRSAEKIYYILSKIDYEARKFVELKKVEATVCHSYNELESNAFEALGISRTGELLEDNEENQ
jgi:hypothetical protein